MANTVYVSVAALLFVVCVSTVEGQGLGTNCTDASNCTTFGSTCDDTKCQCETKYVKVDTKCAAKVNASCQTTDMKPGCVKNAKCTNKVCKCNENYTPNKDMTMCQDNASTLTVSLMLTVAGTLMSRLI